VVDQIADHERLMYVQHARPQGIEAFRRVWKPEAGVAGPFAEKPMAEQMIYVDPTGARTTLYRFAVHPMGRPQEVHAYYYATSPQAMTAWLAAEDAAEGN